VTDGAKAKMSEWAKVGDKLADPYELKARLFPGLLILLPAILHLTLLYGPKNPLVAALGSVLTACGGPYLLSSFVRTHGLRAQERLYRAWGGLPSTIILRHRDRTLPGQTKVRYHELLMARLGIAAPSLQHEERDPARADEAYEAGADALRPLTTDAKAFPFIFKELVAYGFNRNAHGSRWLGLFVALGTILATLYDGGSLSWNTPYVHLKTLDFAHVVVLLASLGMAAIWCGHFTAGTVRLAGIAYAKRLWEALERAPKQRNAGDSN
jgi:hypothetical protein